MLAAMSDVRDLDSLFDEIDRTPYGPAERALVERAAAAARDAGDERREYEAMMRRTNSAKMVGDTAAFLDSLQWCLAKHAADPTSYPARLSENIDLAWQLKWLPGARVATPESNEEVVDEALSTMERFYDAHGLGRSGVLTARFRTAWAMGRLAEAERWRTQLAETPRDAYSHCDACIRSEVAAFFFATERGAEGLEATQDMLANGHECAEEPALALARASIPALRTGRGEQARLWHLRSYESCRDEPTQLLAVASHLEYCALTRSVERGFLLLERHLPWMALDPDDVAVQLRAMRAVALFLRIASDGGRGNETVPSVGALEAPSLLGADVPTSAAPLAERVRAWCERTAARFDERNGNGWQGELVHGLDAVAQESYPGALPALATLTRALANPERARRFENVR